ncbi:hypothetical protein J7M23_01270 [Candidatus Sumerlaeota bacterium]|nr:hypothetical protein [Candidatus Sumerlaeota bacterium]
MKKSLNFGCDNIFFVPEGEPLRIYDLYNWRVLEFDTSKLSVFLNQNYLPAIKEKIYEARERFCRKESGENRKALQENIDKFISSIQVKKFQGLDLRRAQSELDALFYPQSIRVWLRISDEPLESFFEEDYPERPFQPQSPSSALLLPVNGSIYLGCVEEFETALPLDEESGGFPFVLQLDSEKTVQISQISAFEFLPLIDDFCGAFGSSGRGNLINYTHHATVSQENLAALPLYRVGDCYYSTLYFSLSTKVEYDVMMRITEKQFANAFKTICRAGFQVVKEYVDNYIFRRGDDVVHLYGGAASKESLSASRFLPPFLLVVANDTDFSPEQRSKLLALFSDLFSR